MRRQILPRLAPGTKRLVAATFDAFERIINPVRMTSLKTEIIDQFVAVRRTEKGKKAESTLSPATVNRDLRHLKAALRVAHDWGMLPIVPKLRRVREDLRMGHVITPEHFEAIFNACDI